MSETRSYLWLEELLEDPDLLKPPKSVVPRLVWENRLTMLAGREKGGKSTLAGACAAAVSSGGDFLGDACLPGNVLIISLEEHPQEFVQRLMTFGADPKKVAIVQGGSTNLVKTIRDAAEEVKPALIIWDTLGAFARHVSKKDLEPNDSQGWTAVMLEVVAISRDYGASLLLHHANKSDGSYRDSTAIGANVDAIIEMFGKRGSNVRTLRTVARFPTDEEVRIALNGSRFDVLDGAPDLDGRILTYVSKNPRCSFNDIAEGVPGRRADLAEARDRLLKKRALTNVGNANSHSYMVVK